jgi:polysaccharide export outer membrane protein
MTPLQAIAIAGGPTPYAHTKRIYILRGLQGKQEKIPFNYKAALRGDNPRNVILEPNDTVVVP